MTLVEWFDRCRIGPWAMGYADGYNLLPQDERLTPEFEYRIGYLDGRIERRYVDVIISLNGGKL